MSGQKPREWWIEEPDEYPQDEYNYAFKRERDAHLENIHVIEKSAYDTLAAENERLRELVRQAIDIVQAIADENEQEFDWVERAEKELGDA